MIQAQPPSVGLQRVSADARTLDWVSLPQLTRVCDLLCDLQKPHCRSGANRLLQLDLGVTGASSSASMATLWLYQPRPRPWRPPPSPRTISRGAPLLPEDFSRSERAACASSRAREAGMRGVLAAAEDWRWGLT